MDSKNSSHIIVDGLGTGSRSARASLPTRFGKKQMFVLASVIMITWEAIIYVSPSGLLNGGPAGLLYGYLFCWVGFTCVALSLGELTSMYPTAAGQYAWVARLAAPRYRKPLSFLTGWQLVLAWQADFASVIYLGGAILQSLVTVRWPDFVFTRWQGTLLLYGITILASAISLRPKKAMHVEVLSLVVHVVAFIFVTVTLAVLAWRAEAKATASYVFTTFRTGGGYDPALTFFIGLVTSVYPFIGADGIIHLSEEVANPKRSIPSSLASSMIFNGLAGLIVLIAVLFNISDANSQAYSSPNGLSFLQLLASPESPTLAQALGVLIFVLVLFCSGAVLMATTRITWAFARDNGLPGSRLLSRIDRRTELPLYSYGLTVIITLLLALINIGSSTAFNAVISLVIASFFGTYALPIFLIARKRWQEPDWIQQNLKSWNLGKWGLAVNIFSLLWISVIFFFSFWPVVTPVTLDTMNWAVLLWGSSMLFGCAFYFKQKRVFVGPEHADADGDMEMRE